VWGPGRGVRRDTGADTQGCPYDKHRKIFAQLLKMIEKDSPEMEKVVDHFVSFLENGLTLEQRQGVRL
jgi:hypothetical protein